VQTTSGLVSSVSGTQSGAHTYSHEGELLSADQNPEGTTTYKYDASARLTKVTLPNGTIAEIIYDSTGRATKVTVDPAGAEPPKSTNFSYTEEAGTESRKTTVEPEGQRRTFYAIGADGSVLRWWNAEVPPSFKRETGTLIEKREKELGIGDQTLEIEGYAAEGISTIQFIANGNTVVDERTYSGTRDERKEEHLQWITNTEELPAGTLWIEAVITDSLNNMASMRSWVTVPYIPPPPPGVPQPPSFRHVLQFREEHGLDLDLDPIANEMELHERVIETLGSWRNPQTPVGEVAYAAYERWGVPLRPVDVAELEYREKYTEYDFPLIEEWGKAHAANAYGGVYLDERAGGRIRVGFTTDQASELQTLKNEVPLMAPDRLAVFPAPPTYSYAALQKVEEEIESLVPGLPGGLILTLRIDLNKSKVVVGATNVAEAESRLRNALGASVPMAVVYEEGLREMAAWKKIRGEILGGDFVRSGHGGGCSAGLGAFRNVDGSQKQFFLLSAAHCGDSGQTYHRENEAGERVPIGEVVRSGRNQYLATWSADAEAITTRSPEQAPVKINLGNQGAMIIKNVGAIPPKGKFLCHSGAQSQEPLCGRVTGPWKYIDKTKANRLGWDVCFEAQITVGDSGGPVWIEGTHTVVGLATEGGGRLITPETSAETCATPLLASEGRPGNTGALTNEAMAPIHIRLYGE
jgi:YD repeat-containing protein